MNDKGYRPTTEWLYYHRAINALNMLRNRPTLNWQSGIRGTCK